MRIICEIEKSLGAICKLSCYCVLALLCWFLYEMSIEIKPYINDDTDMYRIYDIQRIEDSLIKATGRGHIDTVDFERILNK